MTEKIKELWPQLVVLGAIVVASLRYLFAHARNHQVIDDRLNNLESGMDHNMETHKLIRSSLKSQDEKLEMTLTALRELLVKNGLRKPGQGINGEDS